MTYFLESLVLISLAAMFAALGVHHFIKARRGLRTGEIEGLLVGYGGKRYSRADDPLAFSVNVCAGFLAAAVGAIVIFWALLIVWMLILAYQGQPTL